MIPILTFINSSEHQVILILEPWAEEYKIDPQNKVEIVSNIRPEISVEIEYSDGNIIVYGWSDSVLSVICDGEKMEHS